MTISYEQTIHAYPGGGGAYIVSRDNLGESHAQMAGAALLTDYILTVAVSISSGVAQIVSAYPGLDSYRIELAVAAVFLIMLINLRGVKESGTAFAIPTYFFVVMMFITVGIGLFRYFTGSLGTVVDPPEVHLARYACSDHCLSAAACLCKWNHGIDRCGSHLEWHYRLQGTAQPQCRHYPDLDVPHPWITVPRHFLSDSPYRRVYSRRGDRSFPNWRARSTTDAGMLYLATIGATTVILIMAANTAFADFPRLVRSLPAMDFLPRQLDLPRQPSRVFQWHYYALDHCFTADYHLQQASVTCLIPLYAIGVFLSFTLSQTGMARRWWKIGHLKEGEEIVEPGSTLRYDKGWRFKMFVNGFGAVCTAIVMVVFAVTKFREGAWIVLIIIPILVTIFFTIHHHYKDLAAHLTLDKFSGLPARHTRHRVIMPDQRNSPGHAGSAALCKTSFG